MGKMLLILVIGMGLVAAYSSMQLNQSNLNANETATEDFEINQARNLARSGVEYAVSRMAEDSTWTSGYTNNSISNGALVVKVERTRAMYPGGPDAGLNNARLVTATGSILNQTFTIRAIVEIPTDYIRPPGLGYGILSDQSIDLTGNVFVRDYNNPSINSDIHTNQNLTFGGSSSVKGYGTFSVDCPSGTAGAVKYFQPNVDKGGDVVRKSGPVTIPEIDPEKWESIATRKFYSNTTINGNMAMGTREKPEIVFVRGDLRLNGNMTGYGVFLVTGDITINGTAGVTNLDPSGNNLGIVVGGNAKINGTSDIMATMLIKGDALINGTTKIIGSIIAEGNIDFGGTADVLYNPLLDDVAKKVWQQDAGRPRVVSYYE